jgi:putative peptidoglycan lipid II flippase
MAAPVMIGGSLMSFDIWLLRILGSTNAQGAVTWLEFSRKLMIMLFAMIGIAAGQAALPYLTRLFQEGRLREMGEMLGASLQRVLFLSLVAAAALVVMAEPLVFAAFQRGAFSVADAEHTARLLVLFALGMGAWSVQTMIVRGFYARSDTLSPMLIGTVVLVVSLPIYIGLNDWMGPSGLALSSTLGMTLTALVTLGVYHRRYEGLELRTVGVGLARGLVYALVCGAAAWAARRGLLVVLDENRLLEHIAHLVVMSLAFGAAGGVLTYLWRPPEVMHVLERVLRKLRGA